MASLVSTYTFRNTFYTGTENQPDVLDIFFKKEKNKHSFEIYHCLPFANYFNMCVPIAGCFGGAIRIKNAVHSIFLCLSKKNDFEPNIWNAFKNLFRGIVELLPLTGIFLILFNATRTTVTFFAKVAPQIKDKENILGVSADGKLLFTITIDELDDFFNRRKANTADFYKNKPNADALRLAIFKEIVLSQLKEAEINKHLKMFDVLQKLYEKIVEVN